MVLDLLDVESVRIRSMEMRKQLGSDNVTGFVVQEMVSPGYEIIVGAKRDPCFGTVVLVGHGGTLAEIMGTTSLRTAPL